MQLLTGATREGRKRFCEADRIRKDLGGRGIELMDNASGTNRLEN